MPVERQEDNVTVFVSGVGEAYPATECGLVASTEQKAALDGVLDEGHFIITI